MYCPSIWTKFVSMVPLPLKIMYLIFERFKFSLFDRNHLLTLIRVPFFRDLNLSLSLSLRVLVWSGWRWLGPRPDGVGQWAWSWIAWGGLWRQGCMGLRWRCRWWLGWTGCTPWWCRWGSWAPGSRASKVDATMLMVSWILFPSWSCSFVEHCHWCAAWT